MYKIISSYAYIKFHEISLLSRGLTSRHTNILVYLTHDKESVIRFISLLSANIILGSPVIFRVSSTLHEIYCNYVCRIIVEKNNLSLAFSDPLGHIN